jgi:hypothetical protein
MRYNRKHWVTEASKVNTQKSPLSIQAVFSKLVSKNISG